MAFDWQVALGTALVGVGEKTGQMYDDYKNEQLEIRQEDRRYQTEMRKEREKYNLAQQRQAMAQKQQVEELVRIGWNEDEAIAHVKHGGARTREQQTEDAIADAKTRAGAMRETEQQYQEEDFQADLQRNGNPAPGTDKYKAIQEKHYGAIPTTGAENVDAMYKEAEAKVRRFYPELEPGSDEYKTAVRAAAGFKQKERSIDPTVRKEAMSNASTFANESLKELGENEIEMLGGREAAWQKLYNTAYETQINDKSPGPSTDFDPEGDVEKFQKLPKNQQDSLIKKLEDEGDKESAAILKQAQDAKQKKADETALQGFGQQEQQAFEGGYPKPKPPVWEQKVKSWWGNWIQGRKEGRDKWREKRGYPKETE